jgi:hypothetical protein
MPLKDIMAPKWKHSRPEIRMAAVENMGNDLPLLAEIAKTDDSPEVRIAAVKKINDEAVLDAILGSEKNEQILTIAQKKREAIFEKILATSRDPQAIMETLDKYGNEKVIAAYMCEHTIDTTMQSALIGKIKSPLLLRKITEHGCSLETGEKIVAIVSEKEHLERIAQKASNKKIRILAQTKIEALYPDPLVQQRALAHKLEHCLASMEIKLTLSTIEQGIAQLELSRTIWNEYDPERTHPLASKFAVAESNLADQIKRCTSQKAVLESLESLAKQAELLENEPVGSVQEKLELLQAQWNATDLLGLKQADFGAIADRFTKASNIIKGKIALSKEEHDQMLRKIEAVEKCCNDFETLLLGDNALDPHVYGRILTTWEKLTSSTIVSPDIRQRFADLQKKHEEKAVAQAARKQQLIQNETDVVLGLVRDMESASQVKPHQTPALHHNVVELKRKWERPSIQVRQVKENHESRFSQAYEQFMNNYYEFKDQNSWQQWANENVKTKILAEIELFEGRLQQGESLTHLARKVSAFENQWKRAPVANSEKSKELHSRFTALCYRIFSLGLAKKSDLLETLKKTVSSDLNHDVTDEIKNIQKQWNDIGYLPPDIEKDTADNFYSLCNTFFEQRKEQNQKYWQELQQNIALREDICKEAEKIAVSGAFLEARKHFDELQKRWDDSWPAPMKRSRELWRIFSKSRDLFFENYEAYKQANDAEKETLCEKAEQLLAMAEPKSTSVLSDSENGEMPGSAETPVAPMPTEVNYNRLFHEAIELQKKWKAAGPSSKAMSEKLWNRFNPALKKVFTIINDEQAKYFVLKEALVVEAEALVASEEWEQASQKFMSIQDEWRNLKPAARHLEQMLWNRLQTAGNTFFDRRRKYFDERENASKLQLEEKQSLISELQILALIAGKSNSIKKFETESTAEVLKKGISLKNELQVEGDPKKTAEKIRAKATAIIDKWDSGPAGTGKEYALLERKFNELIGILRAR